ncbi:hypothetical protein J6590_074562 [Homalodisca vitripennis]|nr:hypothetical protein J6590_074562 [Homalodisca vitripennis]
MLLSILTLFSEPGLQPLSQPSGAYNPVDVIAARLNSMYLSEVSVSEVETAVGRTNAAGVDEIPCTVLKKDFPSL